MKNTPPKTTPKYTGRPDSVKDIPINAEFAPPVIGDNGADIRSLVYPEQGVYSPLTNTPGYPYNRGGFGDTNVGDTLAPLLTAAAPVITSALTYDAYKKQLEFQQKQMEQMQSYPWGTTVGTYTSGIPSSYLIIGGILLVGFMMMRRR